MASIPTLVPRGPNLPSPSMIAALSSPLAVTSKLFAPPDFEALERSTHLSRKELAALHVEYKKLANRSGLMDLEAFRKSLGSLGLVQDALLCQRLFSVFNKSATGHLDFAEFAKGLGCLTKGTVDEKLDFAFAMTDIDGSGEISFDELLLTVESMARIYSSMMGGALHGEIDVTAVRLLFNKLDRNGDGTITLDEYKRGMKRHPEYVASLQLTSLSGESQSRDALKKSRDELLMSMESKLDQMKTLVVEASRICEGGIGGAEEDSNKELLACLTKMKQVLRLEEPMATDGESPKAGGGPGLSHAKSASATLLAADPMPSTPGEMSSPSTRLLANSTRSSRPSNLNPASSTLQTHPSALTDGGDVNSPLERRLGSSAKGSTVFFGHKNWDLVLNVMKGIQLAVGRSEHETARPVSMYDFGVKEKYTLVSGAEASHCRFVDYAPYVFARLRDHFGIDNDQYVRSIGPGNMLSNLMLGSLSSLAELGSEGKSGSFFYLSSDGKYFVKTVHKEEHKLLRHLLFRYFNHMTKTASRGEEDIPDSLLTRIVGCHVVRLSKHSKSGTGAVKIYFVVMENALECQFDLDRKFDLKGSWVGRRTPAAQRADRKTTLKDLDLVEGSDRIRLDAPTKDRLMAAMRRDTSFLEQHHIIDYSLLVGFHRVTDAELALPPKTAGPFFKRFHGGLLSSDSKTCYVMGIIDFLTPYGSRKRAERALKTLIFLDPNGISVMPARAYAKRFLQFMEHVVIQT